MATTLEEEFAAHREELDAMRSRFTGREDDDLVLYRFLKGQSFDVDKAEAALNRTLEWRVEAKIDAVRQDLGDKKQMQFPFAQKVCSVIAHSVDHNVCRDNCPLSLERTGMTDPARVARLPLQELIQYHLYHMEYKYRLVNRLSREQNRLVCSTKLMDLHGLGMKHLKSSCINMLKAIIKVSQDNYPEMLNKLIVVNVPWFFNVAWKIVKPWLNERTLAKIIILGTNYQEELHRYIDPANLPEWLHGTCPCGACVPEAEPLPPPPTEVIGRGSKFEQSLRLEKAGVTGSWSFSTKSGDIGFAAEFVADSGAAPITVVANARVDAHKDSIEGAYTAPEPGVLKLVWDNSYSYIYSKTLQYQLEVSELEAIEGELAEEQKQDPASEEQKQD